MSETEDLKTKVKTTCTKTGEKRKHIDIENQSSLEEFFSIQEKHCKYSQEQIQNIKKSSQNVQKECTEMKKSISNCNNEATDITTQYHECTTTACTQQVTDINTELNTHYKHTDSLQSTCQTQCDRLVDTIDKQNASVDKEIEVEKNSAEEQLALTTSYVESQRSKLEEHKQEMRRYIKEEMSECVPTGATPQRREFHIQRNLKRTSDHGTLLDRFRVDNMINIEEEIDSDLEQDSQCQVQVVVEAAEDDGQIADNKSDPGSVKSSTSGVSGLSSVSAASKLSECKENDRQGRPLGAKKSKKNFANVTPRGRTRLPLRQNNIEAAE